MKKIKLKKRRNKLRFKRKLVLTSTLVLLFVLGIGYSFLSVNLNIFGNITVRKTYGNTLYEVLEKESDFGGLATEYIGQHQDSMDPSKSTEKIYHWNAKNDNEGTEVLDKNNVIFGGYCWQMIRTTDTGGVRLLFNGIAENGKCLDSKSKKMVKYSQYSASSNYTQSLNTSYYYGTEFEYDEDNNVFSLAGNVTTGEINIGSYTCKKTTADETCSTLFWIYRLKSDSVYYVYSLYGGEGVSNIGSVQYNIGASLAHVGYMYGDTYSKGSSSGISIENLSKSQSLFTFGNFLFHRLYSKTIEFNNSTYTLINPISGSDIENNDYTGYYTFNVSSTISGSNPYYLVGYGGSTGYYYYVQLDPSKQLSDFSLVIGNSITDNGNGTYTLNNTSSITVDDWFVNYANYRNKYVCDDNSSTCTNPRYITSTTNSAYNYVEVSEKILISKTRNNLQLTNTLLLRLDELVSNVDAYNDYKYTCNSTSSLCTNKTIRFIKTYNSTGYSYEPNYLYGSSITWDGTQYTLIDTQDQEIKNLSTHHYSCRTVGETSCEQVAYVYARSTSGYIHFVYLLDGVNNVGSLLSNMLEKNENDSSIKTVVDAWYKLNLLEYDDYIEDTVFCGDRTISSHEWTETSEIGSNMGNSVDVAFRSIYSNIDLNCPKETDRYSVSNNSAKLTYKIALPSVPELRLLNSKIITSTSSYYTMSPWGTYNSSNSGGAPVVYSVSRYGDFNMNSIFSVAYNDLVRPVISLRPGTEYISGTGSKADPYIVNTFKDDDWATIVNNVRNGKAGNYQVGDTKEVDMGSFGTHTLRVVNNSNPDECKNSDFSQTTCGFVLEFEDIITKHRMNPFTDGITTPGNGNYGGWPATEMRTYINNDIYNALPTDLKNGIINTRVVSSHDGTTSENRVSQDKLYLLSYKEVADHSNDPSSSFTRQLDYYKKLGVTRSNYGETRKKYNGSYTYWWLRTPTLLSNSDSSFHSVGDTGGWYDRYCGNQYGVSPAFRIG